MKVGFITDCDETCQKLKNIYHSKGETIILVEDTAQLVNLEGVIIYFKGDNYFARTIERLLHLRTEQGIFLWVGVPKLLIEEKNILLEMGVNGVFLFPNEINDIFYITKNTLSRIKTEQIKASIKVSKEISKKMVINAENLSIIIDSKEQSLTGSEYKILSLLYKRMNVTVTYEEISNAVWGDGAKNIKSNRQRIANIIFHIREKIKFGDYSINTTRGRGYILKEL